MDGGEVSQGVGVARIDFNRSFECLHGLGHRIQAGLGDSKGCPPFGVCRIKIERFSESLDGLGEATLVTQHHAEIVECVGIAGILGEQGAEDGLGTRGVALAQEVYGVLKKLSGGISTLGLPGY